MTPIRNNHLKAQLYIHTLIHMEAIEEGAAVTPTQIVGYLGLKP